MITITLMNCKIYLEALGIYMDQIGSGELFGEKLSEKLAWSSWEYNSRSDILRISVEEGIEIPDLSEFGEVVEDDGQ